MPENLQSALSAFSCWPLALTVTPQRTLELPRASRGQTQLGGFASVFRKLVCVPDCPDSKRCPRQGTCPYQQLFEPGATQCEERSRNREAPHPFVFRLPVEASLPSCCGAVSDQGKNELLPLLPATKITCEPGERFRFGLLLFGPAAGHLSHFVLSFRELMRSGIGLNGAPCELLEAKLEDLGKRDTRTGAEEPRSFSTVIYSEAGEISQPSPAFSTLEAYLDHRLKAFLPSCDQRETVAEECVWECGRRKVTVRFLTPTYLEDHGEAVREPRFHSLFQGLRERLNALATFYGPGSIGADFEHLEALAERVPTLESNVRWVEQPDRSSATEPQPHLSGFVGDCVYDFSGLLCREFEELLRWLLPGELIHVGKHAPWGGGSFKVTG